MHSPGAQPASPPSRPRVCLAAVLSLHKGEAGPAAAFYKLTVENLSVLAQPLTGGTGSAMQIHPPVKEEAEIYAPMQNHMLFIRGWH